MSKPYKTAGPKAIAAVGKWVVGPKMEASKGGAVETTIRLGNLEAVPEASLWVELAILKRASGDHKVGKQTTRMNFRNNHALKTG